MAKRRWLPALRSLVTALPRDTEAKTITWTGGYTSTSYAGTSNIWSTEGRADGWDIGRVVTEGYERVVWVYKAIDTMGKHAARLPLEIGRGLTEDGEFEEVIEDHPLLRVLNGRANPVETGAQFRKRLSAQILLSKRGAFVEVTRSNRGTITRLDLLPPDRVMPVPDPRGEYIAHYEFTTLRGEVRELDPERVRWIRDPHPTDPFSGVTPLEAAGISVELDHLSRLYNVAFIKNDARPGGIVAVDTSALSDKEMDRLESRFLPGSEYAGHVSVIGSGGMNYVDLAARPREMAYEHAAQNAKVEILAAFGVPESVTGNASGRTFDNAEQEEYGFWIHTELPHLELISNAFADDLGGLGRAIRYDTSTVEALELPRRKRRAEAREEWLAGLISADEYRKRAGLPAFDNPHTRALWISPQKAPVPARPEDAAALGIAGPGAPGQAPAGQMPGDPNAPLPPAPDTSGDAAAAVAQARADAGRGAVAGAAASAVDAARSDATTQGQAGGAGAPRGGGPPSADPPPGAAAAAVAQALGIQVKALPALAPAARAFEVTDEDFDRAHLLVAAALTPLFDRQEAVIAARLRSPKARKGTRYWKSDGPSDTRGGTAPIDVPRVLGTDRWLEEIDSALARVLADVARTTATHTAAALGAAAAPASAAGPTAALVLDAVAAAEQAVRGFMDALGVLLGQGQDVADDIDDLVALVRTAFTDIGARTAETIAENAAVATVNGAAEATAAAVGPGIVRTWVTRRDDRVRAAHTSVDGTTLPVGTAFDVDGYPMRFPADQLAPLHLTINCRCRLLYRTSGESEL
ncbi:phage portal protein [Streptomyces sp. NPDC127110]|uniref:phage portal protein n=1 Tax=Streptomyces sp. NPDC127110 TaxID=3345362 RepID=UPI003635C355